MLFDKEVASCWMHAPKMPLMEIGNNIKVRVHEGEPAYQLSSGEIVRL